MKLLRILFTLFLTTSLMISCKTEANQTKASTNMITENLSLTISGMSCEIGCAKTIESKLNKKEGVVAAKVVFSDSIAHIEYEAEKLDKNSLIAFVEGIGDGNTYKASIVNDKEFKKCTDNKMACCKNQTDKRSCSNNCTKENCATKKV